MRRFLAYMMPTVCLFLGSAFTHGQETSPATPLIDRDLLIGVEDGARVQNADENFAEARAYTYLLVQSRTTSAASLEQRARADLTFTHLFEEPAKCRGELVRLTGRLVRLLRFDPPAFAVKQGVPALYEGWLLTPGAGRNPICIVASEIGPGLQPAEKLDRETTFAGFFFKKYRYPSGEHRYDAPLVIGRTIRLTEANAAADSPEFASFFTPLVFYFLAGLFVLVVGMAYWLRLSDRRARERLEKLRSTRL